MYSFQNPKPYIPKSDESEESQTTPQTPTKLSNTPSHMTSLTNPKQLMKKKIVVVVDAITVGDGCCHQLVYQVGDVVTSSLSL